MFRKMTPNLMVEDVGQTAAYYRDVLGFRVLATIPPEGDDLGWAMVARDNVSFTVQSRSTLTHDLPALGFQEQAVGGTLTFYIEVADIADLFAALKGRVDLVAGLHETAYGTREFILRDNNGYVLAFAEPVQ